MERKWPRPEGDVLQEKRCNRVDCATVDCIVISAVFWLGLSWSNTFQSVTDSTPAAPCWYNFLSIVVIIFLCLSNGALGSIVYIAPNGRLNVKDVWLTQTPTQHFLRVKGKTAIRTRHHVKFELGTFRTRIMIAAPMEPRSSVSHGCQLRLGHHTQGRGRAITWLQPLQAGLSTSCTLWLLRHFF